MFYYIVYNIFMYNCEYYNTYLFQKNVKVIKIVKKIDRGN